MNTKRKNQSFLKLTMPLSIGALTVAAMLILPPLSASAHEWKHERQGPPYGWAKGHDKWKEKYKYHDHEHEWENRRRPYWAHRPVERRYAEHHRPYYHYDRRPNIIYRSLPYDYRYPRDRWQQEYPKSSTDLSTPRDQVTQGRQQLRQQKEELRKDRAELRRDLRNDASKAEIRQDRQEIRQDRQNIAATRKELRRDRATLRSTRQDLR